MLFRIVALAALLLAPGAEARLKIVTTLPNYADLAARVGGDEVEVTALTKGTQDPHFVDPKPSLVLQLSKADVLIRTGLGLEDGWLPPLLTGSRNGKIQVGRDGYIEGASFVKLLEVPEVIDRSQGDVHPGGNPHFLLDPRNGVKVARGIAERLAKIEPSKAKDFTARADAFAKEMEPRIAGWEAALKALKGQPLVTYHKSWIYFTAWLGIKDAGFVEPKPGIPPSPEHVVRLTGQIKEQKIRGILIEPYYPTGTSEQVAKQTGARLVVLPTEVGGAPGADSYPAIFDEITRRLKAAL